MYEIGIQDLSRPKGGRLPARILLHEKSDIYESIRFNDT